MTSVRVFATFLSVWLGFAMIGGFFDGQLFPGYDAAGAHTGDAAAFDQATQPEINLEGDDGGVRGLFSKARAVVSTTWNFLTGWFHMLALNFSFFTGSFAIVGWIVRGVIGIPMITSLLIALR